MRTLLGVAVATVPYLMFSDAAIATFERVKRLRQPKKTTLVVGGGVIARRAIFHTLRSREYGLQVSGVVDDDPKFMPEEPRGDSSGKSLGFARPGEEDEGRGCGCRLLLRR